MYILVEDRLVTDDQFKRSFENTSFPEGDISAAVLEALGAERVLEGAKPSLQPWQSAVIDGTEVINGQRVTKYRITPEVGTQAETDAIAAWQAAKATALQNVMVMATQERLDNFAQTRGYDSILSACTYMDSSNPQFASEATYCLALRDRIWGKLNEMLAEVQAEKRPIPEGFADIEDELFDPTPEWPA